MSDPLRTYKAGEQLSVRTVNELTRRAKRGGQFSGPMLSGPQTGPTVFYLRNAGGSGEDCPRNGVFGISGVAIDYENNADQFLNKPVLDGVIPEGDASSGTGHAGKFAIALEPIAAGDIGRVVISGGVPVQIDVIDEEHKFADIKDGDNTMLESSPRGAARILYKEEGTGTVWAVVNIGGGSGTTRDVRCTQTGGSAGNKTTQCSYTYTIKEMDNTTVIATGVVMLGNGQRVVNAAMTAGTVGRAFYDGTTWKLLWVDEKLTQTNCT